jgi:hypothetical protein
MMAEEEKPTLLEQIQGTEKLVHHVQQPATVYDVVYSGKTSLRVKRQDELMDNTVQIEVNLANLRKLYPSLNTFDMDIMKLIGSQLITGIQINEEGRLLIDNNKINPSCISIVQNKISDLKTISQFSQHKPELQKTLTKKTTYFDGIKFLVVINYIERKINKILPDYVDHVFEEYEILFQLIAIKLS